MHRHRYDELLDRYVAWGRANADVLGIVAVGSTAALSREPDQWSDHDVLVLTQVGTAASIRADLAWVPDHGRLLLEQQETTHGFVLLDDAAHLVELAGLCRRDA